MLNEGWSLIKLRFLVEGRSFMESMRVLWRYYTNPSFAITDLLFLTSYLFHNPFRMVRCFFVKQGNLDSAVYGETPLTSMERITKGAGISHDDSFFELGSGRGRISFWMQVFTGCSVVGIEALPDFITKANRIVKWRGLKNITFRQENMLQADLSQATVIYLYGTCLRDEEIKTLISRISHLPSETKIITVSYPLTDYTSASCPLFQVIKKLTVSFPWGDTEVFIQKPLS